MCAGSFNMFVKMDMGNLNGVISLDNSHPSSGQEYGKTVKINTAKCKGSPNGWYWIYIGSITTDKPNTEIKFEISDTEDVLKTASVVSHVEVLHEDELSDEQSHALQYGWAFALSSGGGTYGL